MKILILIITLLCSTILFAQVEDSSALQPVKAATPQQRFLLDSGSTNNTSSTYNSAYTSKFCPSGFNIEGIATMKATPPPNGWCAPSGEILIIPNGPCKEMRNSPSIFVKDGTYCSYHTSVKYRSCDEKGMSIYWEIWCDPTSS